MKLISVNIECRKHLDRLEPFLRSERPDVVCVQELCKQNISFFEKVLGLSSVFVPMSREPVLEDEQGIGIFASVIKEYKTHWLGGHEAGSLVTADETSRYSNFQTTQMQLLVAKIDITGTEFTIGTTHLPATPKGELTDYQQETLSNLLKATANYEDLVLCGDFNAPRGGEIFSQLAVRYRDNIPPEYETSLDADLHRAGYLPYMVDGLFSTPDYQFSNVELRNGLSDHWAVIGMVERV